MKSSGLQNFQFPYSLENREKFGSATLTYTRKAQLFVFFMNWEKSEGSSRETFKNPQTSL